MINKNLKDFKINKNEISKLKWFSKKDLLKDIKSNPKLFLPSVKRIMKLK